MRNRGLAYKGGTMRAWAVYDELAQRPIRFRRSMLYIKARISWREGWIRGCAKRKGKQGLAKLAAATVARARATHYGVIHIAASRSLQAQRELLISTPCGVQYPVEALKRCPTMEEMGACLSLLMEYRRSLKQS